MRLDDEKRIEISSETGSIYELKSEKKREKEGKTKVVSSPRCASLSSRSKSVYSVRSTSYQFNAKRTNNQTKAVFPKRGIRDTPIHPLHPVPNSSYHEPPNSLHFLFLSRLSCLFTLFFRNKLSVCPFRVHGNFGEPRRGGERAHIHHRNLKITLVHPSWQKG